MAQAIKVVQPSDIDSKIMLPIVNDPRYSHETAVACEYHFYEACKSFSLAQVKRESAEVTNVADVKEQTEQLAIIKSCVASCIVNGVETVLNAVGERFQYRSSVFSLRYDGHVQYLEQTDSYVGSGIVVLEA